MVIFGHAGMRFNKSAVLTFVGQAVGMNKITLFKSCGNITELLMDFRTDIAGIVIVELRGIIGYGIVHCENRRQLLIFNFNQL